MQDIGRVIMVVGLVLVVFGGALWLGGKVGLPQGWPDWLRPGRLPGDIVIDRPGFKFYFPLATGVLLSLVVSLVIWIIRFFGR
ncbi:DUF2905 domain-containing protein [Desulfohalovibrio reitneri]|uniref:DUF2905 domain-containing protein n=1 Tax=Desulfohalovibrio reitneri TaxID=1307759 RepID=UPI0004A77330|nr:DUF2905 domain-containing protein [Desulfohalovibrio reitneri]